MRFTLSIIFVTGVAVIVMADGYTFNAKARVAEAEAARESATAQRMNEQAALTRAEGERSIIEASADAVRADTRAAHGPDYALGWQFITTFVGCAIAALLLCSIPIIYGRRQRQSNALSGDVWQQRALYWQRVAWMLAGSLRARENLTVAERNVLQMAEREV